MRILHAFSKNVDKDDVSTPLYLQDLLVEKMQLVFPPLSHSSGMPRRLWT